MHLPIMPCMPRKYCYHCYRPQQNCFCPFIKPFDTFTHFSFLMHPKEARKQKTGTGRLAQLCLNNSHLFIGEDFSGNQDINRLLANKSYYPLILFPGKNAINISQEQITLPEGKTPCVFVIDGTWRSAKKVLRLSRNLDKWPQIRFAPKKSSQFLIKKEPDIDCVSTIEAVFYYLKEAEKLGWEDCRQQDAVLLEILERLVHYQLKFIRKKPNSGRPYSP